MMELGDGGNEAHTAGPGQAVNVVISDRFGKWLFAAVVALMLFIVWATETSVSSEHKAAEALRASQNADTNLAMIALWMREVKAVCDVRGVAIPKLPTFVAAKEPD